MKTLALRRLSVVSAALGLAALLGGCTSLSGLSGSSSYACKAPDGVTCQSVSGTYANTQPGRRAEARVPAAELAEAPSGAPLPSRVPTATSGSASTPLRSPPRILRLWFKPWEDADQDLYDQGYVYVQVDGGRWLVEHARRAIRESYAPIKAPSGSRAASAPAGPTSSGGPTPGLQRPVLPDLPVMPRAPTTPAEPND